MATTAELREITQRLAEAAAGGPLDDLARQAAAAACEITEVLDSAERFNRRLGYELSRVTGPLVDLLDPTPPALHLG